MPTRNTIIALFITLAIIFTTTAHATDTIRYVNKSNTNPTQDGLTWQTAFDTIQPAIDLAFDAGGGEVWVAAGIYDEARTSVSAKSGDNTGSVLIKTDVALLGGFDGSELSPTERNPDTLETVIDGSESRDGQPAWHVVLCESDSVIDGFTIRGGNASSATDRNSGSAILAEVDDVQILNCKIRNFEFGAPVIVFGDRTVVKSCRITDNPGTGLVLAGENLLVEGCVFRNNTASGTGGLKIETNNLTTSTVRNCVFDSNEGGGAFSAGGASALGRVAFENCLFTNNIGLSSSAGGAVYYGGPNIGLRDPPFLEFSSCTFARNSSVGRIILAVNVGLNMRNCIVWDNDGTWVAFTRAANNKLTNCIISDDGLNLESFVLTDTLYDNPLFVNPAGGDYRLRPQSVAIDAGTDVDAPDTDLDGNARPLGDGFDIGAYEFDPEVPFEDPFDATGDTSVNAADIQHLINQVLGTTLPITDINNDGTTNATDIQLIINRLLGMI